MHRWSTPVHLGGTANPWRRRRRSWTNWTPRRNRFPPNDGCWPRSARRCCRCPRDGAPGHPYLVTPEHTAVARGTLGDGPWLLPEQTVILTDSAEEARAIGTDWLRSYLALPNYANNLLRSGFSEEDLAQVSDRLFDAIIAWGDEEAILRRVSEHRSAGADHVCIQVLLSDPKAYPREQWRRIAAALT